jgi:uncharacterized protein (TIGR02646 family)
MIRIRRPANADSCPRSLRGTFCGGTKERGRNEEVIRGAWTAAEKLEKLRFTAYDKADVRKALAKLFKGKCGYCEGSLSTQSLAIEHFRPKKGFVKGGKLVQPGYWWLAAEWSNLLASCNACNQSKGNHFPLVNEARRARSPGTEVRENPLLLNPCDKDFEHREHVFFLEGLIKSRNKKATRTIKVLDLNRELLLSDRRAELTKLRFAIKQLYDRPPKSKVERKRRYEELQKSFTSERSRYLSMLLPAVDRLRIRWGL